MKRTSHMNTLLVGGALAVSLVSPGFAGNLPLEPGEERLMNEDVNIITGLYTREYSLTGSGVVDYKTARQIVLSEYNEYWNSVVDTREFPLFYWYDANHDGQFEMWVDSEVEGCRCDIHPHEPLQENPWDGFQQPTQNPF